MLLDLVICTVFQVDEKSGISLVCNFLQYVTSFVLSPDMFLVTLLLNTLSIRLLVIWRMELCTYMKQQAKL